MTIASHDGTLTIPLDAAQMKRLSISVEELIQALPSRHQAFAWGVCHLDYTLATGVLIIRTLDAVMPNGFHIVRGDDRLRLDLRPLPPGDHTVYLVVTLLPPDEANRFLSSEPAVTADEVLGDDGLELPRVRARLALVTTPSASQETSLPLLKIIARHQGTRDRRDDDWTEATTFVPPMLKVRPGSTLGRRCLAIADRLHREADALTRLANTAPPTLATVEARSQLGPLISTLAAFEALLSGEPHPFALYVEFCRLAAAAAMLRRHSVPVPPPYDHNDAWKVFNVVARAFAPAATGKVLKFTFQREGQLFRLPPDDGWSRATAGATVILAVESDASEELTRRWGENCVIGSRSRMALLESRRILGPSRTYVKYVDGIPADRRSALFALTPDANMQTPDEDLFVVGSTAEVKPTAVHLYVVQAKGESANG